MGRKANWPPLVKRRGANDRVYFGGRWHHLGPAGSAESKANYARLLAAWSADPSAAIRPAGELLCVELFAQYLAGPDSPPGGPQRDRYVRAQAILSELHLTTAVADFGPVALRAWQAWMCAQVDGRGERRWNRTYISSLVSALKGVWKWAVSTERIVPERYQALQTVRGPRFGDVREAEEVKAADPADVAATLPFLRAPTRAMVQLQVLTGARPGEVCQMRGEELIRTGKVEQPGGVGFVDLEAEGVWVYLPSRHKKLHRRKPRFVVLGPQAQAVVTPFLEGRDPKACLFSPAEATAEWREAAKATRTEGGGGNKKRPAIEPKRRPGEAYTTRTYREAVERAAVRAGVPHWHPHQLRHLAGANADFAGGLDDAQAMLGHDKPDTTRRYSKRSFKTAARVAREMG